MRIVALEEHILPTAVRNAWSALDQRYQDDGFRFFDTKEIGDQLADLSAERLRRMDETGIDVQVLSLTTPAVQNLEPANSTALARDVNDLIAATIRETPDRFEGFATLPTPAPEQAARELERAVTELGLKGAMLCGRTRECNLDHPDFRPIFEAAASLGVPLYIHPQTPQRAIRDIYYTGFGEKLDIAFATGGIGWHYETGIQLLRLILAGTFDRHPALQVILGHWGEVVLFFLKRVDVLSKLDTGLQRPVADYVRSNVCVTPSGVLSQSYLQRTVEILGADRILFSTDYPFVFAPDGGARRFLQEAALDPADREKIAHGNWDRLSRRAGLSASQGAQP